MQQHDEQTLIDAFQMMWGRYPEPVRLIHRSFRIVAGNEAFAAMGGAVGGPCNVGDPVLHRGCQAKAALRDGKAKHRTTTMQGVEWVSYWVPVAGSDEYYIHFTNGMNAYIEKMAAPDGGAAGGD